MNINLSLSPATTIINKIAVCIYKASDPGILIDSQEFDPPHSSPRNITFTDVDPSTYIVNTYETTGLPVLGTLRHSFIYDPSYSGVSMKATEFLIMPGGGTAYTDASWVGWEIDTIERVSLGTQYPVYDVGYYQNNDTWRLYRQDGFDLLGVDDTFQPNEKFVVRFKVQVQNLDISTTDPYSDIVRITADTTIDTTHLGKLLLIQGASSVINITLSAIATLGSRKLLSFVSNGGSHKAVVFTSDGGVDPFQFSGLGIPEIVLGQSESMDIITDSTYGHIVKNASSTIQQAGQFVDAYDLDNDPNLIHADGSLLDRQVYRRLWNAVNRMPAGVLVSDATWSDTTGGANNKGFYSTGNGSTTFRIPRVYAAGVLKAVDGSTRLPGNYEADMVGPHVHPVADYAGGNSGPLHIIAPTTTGLQGSVTGTNVDAGSGDETTVKNFGVFKMIRI